MHLGGIGTGNVEIGADGQFTTWQLFNTLRDGMVPFCFLARAGKATRLLQTRGGPDWPRIKQISMTGEYPVATLRFTDPDLPPGLELTAFSPFAPLDTKLSSIPAAVLVFKVHNPTEKPLEVSLAALFLNPVGYDAAVPITGNEHPNFGGNVAEVIRDPGLTGFVLKAEPGNDPAVDRNVLIATLPNLRQVLVAAAPDWPRGLRVEVLDQPPKSELKFDDPAHTLIWMEDAPAESCSGGAEAGSRRGDFGRDARLLGQEHAASEELCRGNRRQAAGGRRSRADLVFEDFENGYKNWRVEGAAFGPGPAAGTLPGQQPVSGFEGKGLVNSFRDGDDTTGRLVSKEFTVERSFIRFLVGGGSRATTQVRLVVDGKTVRAASGRDLERLQPAFWDVSAFRGKSGAPGDRRRAEGAMGPHQR